MRLIRLTKKNRNPSVLGKNPEWDINWASGPGFRDGPEDYFCLKVEADDHDYALELNVDESRHLKQQIEKFLGFIDNGQQMWEPGNYFKKLKTGEKEKQ
jgi:hypothetical protein